MDANWLVIGGDEVVNTARVRAYAAGSLESDACTGAGAVVGCACPGLAEAVEGDGFPGYLGPSLDPAPWFDEAVPESAEFLGVAGVQAEGLGGDTAGREPTRLARGGANIGPVRFSQREVVYRAVLVSSSAAGDSYGMGWLASNLRGTSDGPGACWGEEACLFAWCPDTRQAADRAQRHMFDVGTLDALETVELFRAASGAVYRTVEFTLVSGNPHLYTSPYASFSYRDAERDVVRIPPGGPQGECEEVPPCRPDPYCPPPPLPPLPPEPVDPCWPQTGFQASRAMFTVPPGGVPVWFEVVPVVRIHSGDEPLRRISMRFYANPSGASCLRDLDRCGSCGEANIAHIPANSELVLDGRRQRVSVDCSGGRGLAVGEPIPYGPGGGLFSWPVMECTTGLCVEVTWQRQGASADARVEVDMVARQGAV